MLVLPTRGLRRIIERLARRSDIIKHDHPVYTLTKRRVSLIVKLTRGGKASQRVPWSLRYIVRDSHNQPVARLLKSDHLPMKCSVLVPRVVPEPESGRMPEFIFPYRDQNWTDAEMQLKWLFEPHWLNARVVGVEKVISSGDGIFRVDFVINRA
jgi:hypothetical protein